jgi:hypothetical protein
MRCVRAILPVLQKDDIAAKLSKPAREDWQLAVFRQLVSKIVNSEDGTAAIADVHAAKHEVDCLKTIKTTDLDAEVNSLMRQGWITSAKDARLTLGESAPHYLLPLHLLCMLN